MRGALHRAAVEAEDLRLLARQDRPVAILQVGDGVGEGRERDGVGAQVHLAVAVADRQRRPLAGADHQVVLAGEDEAERERAAQPLQRAARGLAPAAGPGPGSR